MEGEILLDRINRINRIFAIEPGVDVSHGELQRAEEEGQRELFCFARRTAKG
jgi:hypothetical protein